MGCPVLTVSGDSFPSRVASSLLSAVELDDLVGRAAANTNVRRWSRELEFAYRTAIARRNEGLTSASFDGPLAGATCTE